MIKKTLIQSSIEYIENHLLEELTLEQIAAYAGFSPYHFHRLFRRTTGMNIADYIRQRRLSQASVLLLHSHTPILDIALHCHFESQEAFTRSFKKIYGLPPGRYRQVFASLSPYLDKGESIMDTTSPIKGWFLSGTDTPHYEIGLDHHTVHTGSTAAYLKSIHPVEPFAFATLMQEFRADHYTGKRIRFSGFVKTSNVHIACGLWMRVDGADQQILQFDNMNNRPISGDTDWNHYAIVLDIPQTSEIILIGILLTGTGQVWVDGFRFEEVDHSIPVTNLEPERELPNEPLNLAFEEL